MNSSRQDTSPKQRIGPVFRAAVRLLLTCCVEKSRFPEMELMSGLRALSLRIGGLTNMLVERGLQVMNVEAVGEAYAIASTICARPARSPEHARHQPSGLLETSSCRCLQRGEYNKIRLAQQGDRQI